MSEWWQDLFISGDYRQLEDIAPEQTGKQVDFALGALNVGIGDRLLDVACGIGRHSVPFAAAGLSVTGVDISPVYLATASERGERHGARFVQGDMRYLPVRSDAYDAAVNLFTSFGYFATDDEDQRVLHEIGRALRPGGRFLLDVSHHDGLIARFQERDWMPISDGLLLESRTWDARKGRAETVWTYVRAGATQSYPVSIRMYTCPEIERMLAAAGMRMRDLWGDWDGAPLTMRSWRMIVLAEKVPGRA